MPDDARNVTFTYRAGVHLYVLIGIPATILFAIAVAAGVRTGDWKMAAVVVATVAVWFALLAILKLEIRTDGFRYRNLTGVRSIQFADIEYAYFVTLRSSHTPQGVASFWVRSRSGAATKVNLRTFPIRAAAVLFAALDAHQIPIQVPDTWAARRMAKQIRDAQAKLPL